MSQTTIELAEQQLRDYRAREPGTCFARTGFALDPPAAYLLQDAVVGMRVADGERVTGFKVGCTGPGTTAQFGMAGPIRGCLFAGELRHDGDTIDPTTFANLAIEGEMAIRVGDDGGIAAVFPIIELHHFVFRAPRKTLGELIANNGLNGGVVLPSDAWQASRTYIGRPGVLSVRINGKQIESGNLWPLAGGPLASLAWLKQHLADFGKALEPGQIVLAGTPLGLNPVGPGDDIAVYVDDEFGVRCKVAARS